MEHLKKWWVVLIIGVILGGTVLAVPVAMLINWIKSQTGAAPNAPAAGAAAITNPPASS